MSKGRLIALEAEDIGEFMTVAFIPPGKKMKINAVTKRAGKILVEVVSDSEDKVLAGRSFEDCDPIIGDKFWVPARDRLKLRLTKRYFIIPPIKF